MEFLKKIKNNEPVIGYVYIVLGCIVGGAAYPLFLVPNGIAPGGLTGVATVLNYLFGAPVGVTSLLMNVPLFLMGYKLMGGSFAFRSMIATVLFSLLIDLFRFPALTDDVLLASVYGAILLGVGLGLILRGGATTGGSDMIAKLVHHRLSFVSVGMILLFVDCTVIALAAFTMSTRAALYSLICIFVSSKVIDLVLAGFGSAKMCFVVSAQSAEIASCIMKELDRGVTLLPAVGGYTGKETKALISVVDQKEVLAVKRIVREADARAFMFITDTHETLGEGFRSLNEKE
ncbi:MAG: YitT family protein [Clostridia bacterium]|nr:YitT family protein [Clostridia bacterium]